VNIQSQLIHKKIELKKNLNERRFSLARFDYSLQEELERKILSNELNPRDYWCFIPIEKLEVPPQFTKLMRDYHTAAMVQVVFFEITLQNYYEESKNIENSKKLILHKNEVIMNLSEILGWGFYYWAFAEDFNGRVQRAQSLKASKGGSTKANKRAEKDVLLSSLVKWKLEHYPPDKGWPDLPATALLLAKSIEEFEAEHKFPIGEREDILEDIISILDVNDVKKVYEMFAKNSRK